MMTSLKKLLLCHCENSDSENVNRNKKIYTVYSYYFKILRGFITSDLKWIDCAPNPPTEAHQNSNRVVVFLQPLCFKQYCKHWEVVNSNMGLFVVCPALHLERWRGQGAVALGGGVFFICPLMPTTRQITHFLTLWFAILDFCKEMAPKWCSLIDWIDHQHLLEVHIDNGKKLSLSVLLLCSELMLLGYPTSDMFFVCRCFLGAASLVKLLFASWVEGCLYRNTNWQLPRECSKASNYFLWHW